MEISYFIRALHNGIDRIALGKFLFLHSRRIFSASNGLAFQRVRCCSVAIHLPSCRSHQEISLADRASSRIVTVVQALEEICQNKAVVIVKKYPSRRNHRFTFSGLSHSDILGCNIKFFIAEYIQSYRQQMRLVKQSLLFVPSIDGQASGLRQ